MLPVDVGLYSYLSLKLLVVQNYFSYSGNISNKRDGVSSGYPNTEKRVENTTRSRVVFEETRGVWITDETLSRMFDISSQSKQKLRSKRRSKMVKIMLIKTG